MNPKSFIICLFIYSFIGLFVQTSFASERSFTISPPTIEATINPGDSTAGSLTIRNNSDTAISFVLSTKDFIVNDTNGIPLFTLDTNATKKYLAKDWISVFPQTFTLQPQEKQTISYNMQVPTDATAGGHYGAVIYHPEASPTDSGATIQAQLASLFLISVTGPIHEYAQAKLQIPHFQESGPLPITLTLTNQGDVHIRPTGTITVYDVFGREIHKAQIDEKNIFPSASRIFTLTTGNTWMLGPVKITFLGSYGTHNNIPLLATNYAWIIPWKAITVGILLIAILVVGCLLFKKKST